MMNLKKMKHLHKYLDTLEIDIERGLILNRNIKAPDMSGYYQIKIRYVNYKVHQVIAFAGGLDILDKTVDHMNGNKLDNRIANLRPLTNEENARDGVKYRNCLPHLAERNERIRADYAIGVKQANLARKYDMSPSQIWQIVNNRTTV